MAARRQKLKPKAAADAGSGYRADHHRRPPAWISPVHAARICSESWDAMLGRKEARPGHDHSDSQFGQHTCAARQGVAADGTPQEADTAQLAKVMNISADLASKTKAQCETWTAEPVGPAAEMFVGDIYSGLQIDLVHRRRSAIGQRAHPDTVRPLRDPASGRRHRPTTRTRSTSPILSKVRLYARRYRAVALESQARQSRPDAGRVTESTEKAAAHISGPIRAPVCFGP